MQHLRDFRFHRETARYYPVLLPSRRKQVLRLTYYRSSLDIPVVVEPGKVFFRCIIFCHKSCFILQIVIKYTYKSANIENDTYICTKYVILFRYAILY